MPGRPGLWLKYTDPKTGETYEVIDKYAGAELLEISSNYFLHEASDRATQVQVPGQKRSFWRLSEVKQWKSERENWTRLRCEICKRLEDGRKDLYVSFQRRSDASWYSLCRKCHKQFTRTSAPWGHHELPGETLEERQTWGWLLLAHSISILKRNIEILESGRWKTSRIKKRVLIVEDDKRLREVLEEAMRREGCVVVSKASLTAGMRKWRGSRWDGLYTSFQLESQTAKKLIQQAGKDQAVPIVVSFTGEVEDGATDFMYGMKMKRVERPFSFDDVIKYFRKSWQKEEEVRRR